eukprot:286373-Rhodomonas_salina.1
MDAVQTHEIIKQVQSRGEPFTLRNGHLTSNKMKLLLLGAVRDPEDQTVARTLWRSLPSQPSVISGVVMGGS